MSIGQLKINAIRLVGGSSVLDYLNSCDGRRPGTSLQVVVDKLSSLEDIVHWFLHAGLIDPPEHERSMRFVRESSWHSIVVFKQLVGFREALYRLFLPIALGHPVDQAALDELNAVRAATASQCLLVSTPTGVVWRWRPCDSVESMATGFMGRLAVQACALLTSQDLMRLKACATPDCDWLFLDTSKNGRRRWCQMNVCGAREKVRRSMSGAH